MATEPADVGRQGQQARHAARWCRQPAARQHLHEPVPEALAAERRGEAFRAHVVAYADDFVILSRGRAAEALAWTKAVMTKLGLTLNEAKTSLKRRPQGALRLPWLLVRTALVQEERQMVPGREPVQEEHAAAQDEGRRPAGARQHGAMGGCARRAEQHSARLVALLLLRDACGRLPKQSTSTSTNECATSSPDGTRCRARNAAVLLRCRLRRTGPARVSNACPERARRGPRGEASRRAGCGKSARPVR